MLDMHKVEIIYLIIEAINRIYRLINYFPVSMPHFLINHII